MYQFQLVSIKPNRIESHFDQTVDRPKYVSTLDFVTELKSNHILNRSKFINLVRFFYFGYVMHTPSRESHKALRSNRVLYIGENIN